MNSRHQEHVVGAAAERGKIQGRRKKIFLLQGASHPHPRADGIFLRSMGVTLDHHTRTRRNR